MSRFHVGDIVTVRPDLVENNIYYMENRFYSDSFVSSMMPLRGKRVTITSCYSKYRIAESGCNWTDEMFEEYFRGIDYGGADSWIAKFDVADIDDMLCM